MSVDIQRDCAEVNAAFFDSQTMFAALRLFCKRGVNDELAKPFWSVARGFVYACNGQCAIRIKTDAMPADGVPAESVHAENIERLASEKGEPLVGIYLQDLYEAAEVSIAISRERNGVMDGEAFDERSDMAFVSVPGVGVYRADFLLDAYRAFGLLALVLKRVFRLRSCLKGCSVGILRIGELSDRRQVFICPMHGGNVRDSRWVVVEAGTLRERVERSFSDIVGVAE